jgi:hypothetical protein
MLSVLKHFKSMPLHDGIERMKRLLNQMRPVDIAKISILLLALRQKKFKLSLILGIWMYGVAPIQSKFKLSHNNLLELGAESKIASKYFNPSSIVTFKQPNKNLLTALTVNTVASAGVYAKQSKHIVFVTSTGQASTFIPAMSSILATNDSEIALVVHSYEIDTSEDQHETMFNKWILDDLRATPSDPVIVIAHGKASSSVFCAMIRSSVDLAQHVHLILVNPYTFTGNSLLDFVPFKATLLFYYAQQISNGFKIARVLHEKQVPLVDTDIIEYAILSNRGESAYSTIDLKTPLPANVSVVCGDQDWNCGKMKYEQLNAKLGGKHSVYFLRGLGGHPHLEDPDQFAESILTVLKTSSN